MEPSDVVRAARGWLGTRFHHQGRIKKSHTHAGGVDCLGLLVGVAAELKLRQPEGLLLHEFDEQDYSHLPDTARLKCALDTLLLPLGSNPIQPADIVLLEVDGRAQHLGLISDYAGGLGMIHAYAPARCVVEHALDEYWLSHLAGSYRLICFN